MRRGRSVKDPQGRAVIPAFQSFEPLGVVDVPRVSRLEVLSDHDKRCTIMTSGGTGKRWTCGELTATQVGERATLKGWVKSKRRHGRVVFVDVRDRWGVTQTVFDAENDAAFEIAASLRLESVIAITGTVHRRPEGLGNSRIPTGEIELQAEHVEVLNPAAPLPFR